MGARLFAFERGARGEPIVFLHGFGLSHADWGEVLERVAPERRVIAYDLPGHGGSLHVPHGSAAVAARAVLADLAERGISRAHLVGHSFGGATAAVAALREPGRTASLTLVAPGGFDPAIAGDILRRYGAATDAAELGKLLPIFFSAKHPPPEGLAESLAESRRVPGATEALAAIADTFFEGARQRLLPLAAIAQLPLPRKVLWGAFDRILPAPYADAVPASLKPRTLEGFGHMLTREAPAEVARLVMENAR